MPRIMLVYPDGQTTYGQFDTDEQGPHFILGKVRYTIDDIAKSGAIAAVNSPEMLRTFQDACTSDGEAEYDHHQRRRRYPRKAEERFQSDRPFRLEHP